MLLCGLVPYCTKQNLQLLNLTLLSFILEHTEEVKISLPLAKDPELLFNGFTMHFNDAGLKFHESYESFESSYLDILPGIPLLKPCQ